MAGERSFGPCVPKPPAITVPDGAHAGQGQSRSPPLQERGPPRSHVSRAAVLSGASRQTSKQVQIREAVLRKGAELWRATCSPVPSSPQGPLASAGSCFCAGIPADLEGGTPGLCAFSKVSLPRDRRPLGFQAWGGTVRVPLLEPCPLSQPPGWHSVPAGSRLQPRGSHRGSQPGLPALLADLPSFLPLSLVPGLMKLIVKIHDEVPPPHVFFKNYEHITATCNQIQNRIFL